jgi:hypothetical protein
MDLHSGESDNYSPPAPGCRFHGCSWLKGKGRPLPANFRMLVVERLEQQAKEVELQNHPAEKVA